MADIQDESGAPAGELIARSRNGDLRAFRDLMEAHRAFAFRVAWRLLRDRDDADDAVQEGFIRVWRHLGDFREGMRFTTWLYRIIVNVAYDRIRARERRRMIAGFAGRLVGGGDERIADPPGGDDPAAILETRDLADAVLRQARRLPPKQYLVFHLRDVLQLSVEETAASAGMSVNSVKVNLSHARKRIRAGLKRSGESK